MGSAPLWSVGICISLAPHTKFSRHPEKVQEPAEYNRHVTAIHAVFDASEQFLVSGLPSVVVGDLVTSPNV